MSTEDDKGPSYTKVARHAIFPLAREYGLSANDRWLLLVLVLTADIWEHRFTGAIADLASDTGMSRNTVVRALERLAEARLILVIKPFTTTGNGVIEILVYDRLVVANRRSRLRDE